MSIEQTAYDITKNYIESLSKEQLEQKNLKLKAAANNFLKIVLIEDAKIKKIRYALTEKNRLQQQANKMLNLAREMVGEEVMAQWDSFTNLSNGMDRQSLEGEWKNSLRIIYEQVHIFQMKIFEILEIQSMAYITLETVMDGENIKVRVFEFDPDIILDRQASSKGGGFKARVGFGSKTAEEKDASLINIFKRINEASIENNQVPAVYHNLEATYGEILFRFSAAKQADSSHPKIWWFTDSSQDHIAGKMEVQSQGHLAEAFIGFIPMIAQNPSTSQPPYSGIMDPTDVSAFLTMGVASVDATKGRLVGDVMTQLQNSGSEGPQIQNWAVKAQSASHMGYQQMIQLAQTLTASTNMNAMMLLAETQKTDLSKSKKKYKDLKQEIASSVQTLENKGYEEITNSLKFDK